MIVDNAEHIIVVCLIIDNYLYIFKYARLFFVCSMFVLYCVYI